MTSMQSTGTLLPKSVEQKLSKRYTHNLSQEEENDIVEEDYSPTTVATAAFSNVDRRNSA